MKSIREHLLLYAITDRAGGDKASLISKVEAALRGGATVIQLRDKGIPREALIEEAAEIKALCRKYDVPLIMNDSTELAMASCADGVHIGRSDGEASEVRRLLGPGKILGVSARTVEDAVQAEKDGADYLGVGAIFHTNTKSDAKNISIDILKEICRAVSIPVVAIGGITKDNILALSGSGISGVAVVSAIFAQKDAKSVEDAARDLRRLAEKAACI